MVVMFGEDVVFNVSVVVLEARVVLPVELSIGVFIAILITPFGSRVGVAGASQSNGSCSLKVQFGELLNSNSQPINLDSFISHEKLVNETRFGEGITNQMYMHSIILQIGTCSGSCNFIIQTDFTPII